MAKMPVYLKSMIAGILALLAFVALVVIITTGALLIANGAAGFDIPVVHLHTAAYVLLILVFVAGFYWKFRRLSKSQARSGGIR